MFKRLLLFVCVSACLAAAQIGSIPLQGTLRGSDGTPITASTSATIYVCQGALTVMPGPCGGGTIISTESTTLSPDVNGAFNHMIGQHASASQGHIIVLQPAQLLTVEVWTAGAKVSSSSLFSGPVANSKGSDGDGGEKNTVRLRDDCDPVTFNAAIGAGTCVGDGDTTLNQFTAELTQNRSVDDWKYQPNSLSVTSGSKLTVWNRGGETHTFTKVADFGGGFSARLNQLAGNLTPRPECAQVVNGNLVPQPASPTNMFVKAGTTVAGPAVSGGVTKFQCCIHPWMRTVVTTGNRNRSQVITPVLTNNTLVQADSEE